MRHATHHAGLLEAVQVLENQAPASHQGWDLERAQIAVALGDEQWVTPRQRADIGRVDGEIVVDRMAGCTGPAIAAEGLLRKQPESFDYLAVRVAGDHLARLHQPLDGRIDREVLRLSGAG